MKHAHSVAACVRELSEAHPEALSELIAAHRSDERKGVQTACRRAQRRLERHTAEERRTAELYSIQRDLVASGIRIVVGVDEVGRGALAGPVTAGAALLDPDDPITGLDDSKRLSPNRRSELDHSIRGHAVAVSVAHVSAAEIDRVGIVRATRLAMRAALDGLGTPYDHVLVDGMDDDLGVACTAIVDGDAKCAAIAAASIIAKVERDALMAELDASHPGYDLAVNKGYSTCEHMESVRRLGPSEIHRRSFEPCRQDLKLF